MDGQLLRAHERCPLSRAWGPHLSQGFPAVPESWCSREENVRKIYGARETRVDFVHLSVGDRAALRTIVSFCVKLKLPYEAYALRGALGRGWRSLRFRMLP